MPQPNQDSSYWSLPLGGVARAEAELHSQKVRVLRFFYNKHSEASFISVSRKVSSASLDGLLVAPVANASTHRAAAYVKSRGAAGRVHVIGYDLIDENVRYLREGVVDFLISQQPERQGYEGITTLYRHVVLKEAVPKKVTVQIDITTSENVDFYRS